MKINRIRAQYVASILASLICVVAVTLPLHSSTYLPYFSHPVRIQKRAVAMSMAVGDASPIFQNQTSALDGCFDLAMDKLDATRWFAIATCQFSENSYGHRAGIIRDEFGLLSFTQIGIENTYFSDREVKVRIVSSLVAEPTDGGWQIVSVLLNQVKRENGSLFSGFLSEAEMANAGYVFDFGDESFPIPAGKLELVRGLRDAEVPEHFILFASAGRGDQEVFDHSSGWHQVLIPYSTVLDIASHKLITGRNAAGELLWFTDPWGVNYPTIDAWNAANRDAGEPENHPATGQPWWLVWPGTYYQRSDKRDVFQGGVMHTMVDGESTYISCHSAGVKRWHHDLEEKSQPPLMDCQAAAKLGVAPVSTGTLNLSFQGTGDFAPGWFWHLMENVSGNAFVGFSSLNMEPHQMPINLTITFVEE